MRGIYFMKLTSGWLLGVLILWGCEEPFDFEEDKDIQRPIIITGYIDQSNGPYFVKVSQASATGSLPANVLSACVIVYNEDGASEEFEEVGDGVYRCPGNTIQGEPGGSYYIEVKLLAGQVFRSVSETMPALHASDALNWKETLDVRTASTGLDFQVPVVSIDLTTTIPQTSEPLYFNWVGAESFSIIPTDFPDPFGSIPPPCYVTRYFGSEKVNLFSNLQNKAPSYTFEGFWIRDIDDSFLTKHIFTVYQYGISEGYYNYLQSVKVLVENNGSLFDSPPGRAIGNIYPVEGDDLVQGYFHASVVDTTRMAVFPNELISFIIDDCEYTIGKPFSEYDAHCLNCLNYPGSSYERPEYWTKVY